MNKHVCWGSFFDLDVAVDLKFERLKKMINVYLAYKMYQSSAGLLEFIILPSMYAQLHLVCLLWRYSC